MALLLAVGATVIFLPTVTAAPQYFSGARQQSKTTATSLVAVGAVGATLRNPVLVLVVVSQTHSIPGQPPVPLAQTAEWFSVPPAVAVEEFCPVLGVQGGRLLAEHFLQAVLCTDPEPAAALVGVGAQQQTEAAQLTTLSLLVLVGLVAGAVLPVAVQLLAHFLARRGLVLQTLAVVVAVGAQVVAQDTQGLQLL